MWLVTLSARWESRRDGHLRLGEAGEVAGLAVLLVHLVLLHVGDHLDRLILDGFSMSHLALEELALRKLALGELALGRLAPGELALGELALGELALEGLGLKQLANRGLTLRDLALMKLALVVLARRKLSILKTVEEGLRLGSVGGVDVLTREGADAEHC